ncbi:MAG: type II toxin-antitoxin system VapB family antitoxin [Dehalococcoidia bacterium]|nr:type II toxin-antitoxin system VapB family antitoxin [Dehalococcoidia bacterium]
MRTTLDIDPNLLEAVVALTKESNKGRAVSKALQEYVRRERIEELRAMAGKIEMVDNLEELEELEIREMGLL